MKLTNDEEIGENGRFLRSGHRRDDRDEGNVVVGRRHGWRYVAHDVLVDAHAETVALVTGSLDASRSRTGRRRNLAQAEVDRSTLA